MAIDTRTTQDDRDQYGRPIRAETGGEARQGPLGRPVLYVLLGGLALAALYLIGTMIWSTSEDLPPPNQIQTNETVAPPVNMTPADPAVAPAPAVTPAPALTLDPAPVTPAPVTPAPAPPAG